MPRAESTRPSRMPLEPDVMGEDDVVRGCHGGWRIRAECAGTIRRVGGGRFIVCRNAHRPRGNEPGVGGGSPAGATRHISGAGRPAAQLRLLRQGEGTGRRMARARRVRASRSTSTRGRRRHGAVRRRRARRGCDHEDLGRSSSSARVRPLSYGITSTVEADRRHRDVHAAAAGRTSRSRPNGDILHNVHVFADPIETRVPRPGQNVIFFGPGKHAIPGDHVLRVPSNTTVYIAGGAVRPGLDRHQRTPATSSFGGVASSIPPRSSGRATGARSSSSDRLTSAYGTSRCCAPRASRSETPSASRRRQRAGDQPDQSSDGVNVNASSDVLVDGVFLRTSDDSIAVYATTPWIGHAVDTRA